MAKDVNNLTKAEILKKAKVTRSKIVELEQKYKRMAKKQSNQTARFYDKAAELLKERAKGLTQKEISKQFGKDAALTPKLLAEAELVKSLSKGSSATSVARIILSTRGADTIEEARSQAGARFYAGLKDIWLEDTSGMTDAEIRRSYQERDKRIIQKFGKKNLLEVIKEMEDKLNIDLLNMLSDKEKYLEAVTAIQAYVSGMRDE